MECASCCNPNDPGRRYCRRCGLLLGAYCPLCNFFNAPDDDYCGGCGWDLRTLGGAAAPAASRQPGAAPTPAPETPPAAGILQDEELEGLFSQPPPTASTPEAPAAISQTDIDSFFEKLSEKGDAEYRPQRPAPGSPPENGD